MAYQPHGLDWATEHFESLRWFVMPEEVWLHGPGKWRGGGLWPLVAFERLALTFAPMHVVVLTLNRGRGSGCVARDQVESLIGAGHRVTYLYAGMSERVMGADNLDVPLHISTMPVHEYLPAADAQTAAGCLPCRPASPVATQRILRRLCKRSTTWT